MEGILFTLVFVALTIATLTDIYKKEVPDTVTYSLVILGFSLNIFLGLIHKDLSYMYESLAGFLFASLIGLILFYTAQWGGGDAKLIMGIGATVGLPISLQGVPFLVIFIINSFLVGALYGVAWIATLALFNLELVVTKVRENLSDTKKLGLLGVVFIFIALLIPVFTVDIIQEMALLYVGFLFLLSLFPFLLVSIRIVEDEVMQEQRSVEDLVPGDWVLEQPDGFEINKTGISEEDIEELKESSVESILVKKGIPFVPSFLIAFVTTHVFATSLLDFLIV